MDDWRISSCCSDSLYGSFHHDHDDVCEREFYLIFSPSHIPTPACILRLLYSVLKSLHFMGFLICIYILYNFLKEKKDEKWKCRMRIAITLSVFRGKWKCVLSSLVCYFASRFYLESKSSSWSNGRREQQENKFIGEIHTKHKSIYSFIHSFCPLAGLWGLLWAWEVIQYYLLLDLVLLSKQQH